MKRVKEAGRSAPLQLGELSEHVTAHFCVVSLQSTTNSDFILNGRREVSVHMLVPSKTIKGSHDIRCGVVTMPALWKLARKIDELGSRDLLWRALSR